MRHFRGTLNCALHNKIVELNSRALSLWRPENNLNIVYFFFQAEDGIRDLTVTGVQTCALPIYAGLRGLVQRVDDVGVDQRVHLHPDRGRPAMTGVAGLTTDVLEDALAQGERR